MKNIAKLMTLFKGAFRRREKRMGAMKRKLASMRQNGLDNDSYDLAINFLFGELSSNIENLIELDVGKDKIIDHIATSYNRAVKGGNK